MIRKPNPKNNLRGAKGYIILGAIAFAFSACMSFPKSAQEFREKAPGAMFGKSKSVEAKRPYGVLSAMFQRKAKECLNGNVVTQECGKYSCYDVVNVVKTEVNRTKARTELITKYKMGGNTMGQPEDGMILLVADVSPNSKASKLDFYYGAAARIVEAIETWAAGEERGCPDLTRIMERS